MGRAENFLERQVQQGRRLAALEESSRRPRRATPDFQKVALRDAYYTFRTELGHILRGCENSPSAEKDHFLVQPAPEPTELEAESISTSPSAYFTATVVGSSQLGKTTMLNSLVQLFGYNQPDGRMFPDVDLLPTHDKDRAGLPFPLRIEYHDKFQIHLTRWTAQELEDLMQIVVSEAVNLDPDFFDQLEFQEFEENSFMQFVCEHCRLDEDGKFTCASRAAVTLQADGGEEEKDFSKEHTEKQTVADIVQEVHKYLSSILTQQWFRYKTVTLRCPSVLLDEMGVNSSFSSPPCVLDLPGVGIVHDNNFLVEELVRRNVSSADTIIILTGQRSFTEDVIGVLRSSVFRRLLDPDVPSPPTVAVTNSHVLRGLQTKEMETWREQILHGTMGWFNELKRFADENFSNRRRHRLLSEIEPSLFPNDLSGFLSGGAGAEDVGVATLVGYFMRLPQEVYLARVAHVFERANAYRSTIDELWQAPMLGQKQTKSSRLFRQALAHRTQKIEMSLNTKLTATAQKKMFDWEHPSSLIEQVEGIDVLIDSELEKLHKKFSIMLNAGSCHFQQEIPSLVKQLLLEIASDWDNVAGKVVFERVLRAAQELSVELFAEWIPQLFYEERSADPDPKIENSRKALHNALKAKVPKVISSSAIKYTLTDAYRQMVWNLDFKKVLTVPRVRKGKCIGVSECKVWSDIDTLVRKKAATLQEQVVQHTRQQSQAVKQLVSRLKLIITETFAQSVEDFATITSALESIAQGQSSTNMNPLVVLRKELLEFTTQLAEYLQRHKNLRKVFGEEEVRSILQSRYGSQANGLQQQSPSDDERRKKVKYTL
ncbi:hypothetical protein Mapa_006486 [Marchantia paleacea]|nr:hypothetical protein Mapa_006486 [Marchantia paleacea]